MRKARQTYCALLIVTSLAYGGCTAIQTLPNAARSGDTLAIAMGGAVGNQIVRKETVTVSIADAGGIRYPLKLRDLFRIYSDPTSAYMGRAETAALWLPSPLESYARRHRGQWIGIVDLVDVNTGAPLPLLAGSATLTYNRRDGSGAHGLSVSILPGTGRPNPLDGNTPFFNYHPLDTLEPMPQVMVSAQGDTTAVVGGGLFVFSYVTADFGTTAAQPRAVSPIPGLSVTTSRRVVGGGRTELTVLLTNPHGFKQSPSVQDITDGVSSYGELSFAVIWDKSLAAITDTNWQSSLQLRSGYYVDLNGNVVPGLSPVLTKTR